MEKETHFVVDSLCRGGVYKANRCLSVAVAKAATMCERDKRGARGKQRRRSIATRFSRSRFIQQKFFLTALLIVILQWPGYAEDNLVGRWPLDEGAGTNVVDVSSNAWHGTLEGNPLPTWTSGVSSNALSFDGIQNEVQVPHDAGLIPTNALTVAAWVKAATNLTSEVVAKWSTNQVAGSYLLSLTNGLPKLELMLGGNYTAVTGSSGLTDTNWHQVAGVYDGTAINVYLDATLAGSAAASGTVDTVTDPLRIGLLAGQLDDVRIYGAALSTNELLALYYADSDGDGVPDFMEVDAGTNPNDPNSYPSGGSSNAVTQATSLMQTGSGCIVSQTKTYTRSDWIGNKGSPGCGKTITDILQSDEFPFQPTADHFQVVINDSFFDDEGTIAGLPVTIGGSCRRPANRHQPGTVIPPEKVTIVGKRLQVDITATDDTNCCGNIGWQNVSITWKVWYNDYSVKLVDAQGFQPQLIGSTPSLQTPITNTVQSSFNRVGALTDGASLIVVQLSSNPCSYAGWKVGVKDSVSSTNDAAQLGSLHHGSDNSLPQLPATLAYPGNTNLALGANDTAIFYRSPPSWAFGSGSKEHNIQIELHNPSNDVVATKTLTLRKPPLALVHGWISGQERWDDFVDALQAANIQVDKYKADYHDQSAYGLDVIFQNAPQTIHNALVDMRQNQGIAATRVDVVAHSMGGLVTRWYMTRSTDLPNRADRSVGADPAPLFKTSLIVSQPRAAEHEFIRPDNFGIGDIRRFITLGTPHTGTDWSRAAIRMVNNGINRRSEPGDIQRRVWSGVEQILGFHAIALTDPGDAGPQGMSLIDLAAYGPHPLSGSPAPSKSVALNALAPIPVAYAPIEGIAAGGSLWNSFETGMFRIIAGFTLTAPAPSDLRASNSDAIVPSASARNLNASNTNRVINGVVHFELPGPNPRTGELFEQLLGSDESLFIQP